jgi:hypothetical protein
MRPASKGVPIGEVAWRRTLLRIVAGVDPPIPAQTGLLSSTTWLQFSMEDR